MRRQFPDRLRAEVGEQVEDAPTGRIRQRPEPIVGRDGPGVPLDIVRHRPSSPARPAA
jgi:hypothetical protein